MRSRALALGLLLPLSASSLAACGGASSNGAPDAGDQTDAMAPVGDASGMLEGSTADGSDASHAADGDSSSCGHVTCSTPPASKCVGGSLETYAPKGTCASGVCSYASTTLACPNGCSSAQCVGDPCLGVTCDTPPANTCANGTTLTVYGTSGTCAGGECTYGSSAQPCASGCSSGQCVGDPCAGVTCANPPGSFCADSSTLVTYAATGQCSSGFCSYTSTNHTCAARCSQGQCIDDPCAGVTCNTPPASSCVDPGTLRTYAPTGTCLAGTCSYTASTQGCTYGCAAGQCGGAPVTTIMLVGGNGVVPSPLNDTWTWNGAVWTRQMPSAAPPANGSGSLASLGSSLVLFGGLDFEGVAQSDTAIWNGTTWQQPSLSTSPPPRYDASMATLGSSVVLFGGHADSTHLLNDTWVWNGSQWLSPAVSSAPPPRWGAAMATLGGEVVLFGGSNGSSAMNDTWTWDGTTWTQHGVATPPICTRLQCEPNIFRR